MLLKCLHILVQIEKASDKDFDLIIGQMVECRFQQWRHILLYEYHIIWYRTQVYRNLPVLHQWEHVRQDDGMIGQTCRVGGVGHHWEYLHQNIREVGLVEALRRNWMLVQVLKHL